MSGFFEDKDEDEANGEWSESVNDIRDMPPIIRKVTIALGPRGMSELDRLIKSDLIIRSSEEFMDKIGKIFSRHGLSMMHAIEFVMTFQEMAERDRSTFDDVEQDDVEQDESSARTSGASPSPMLTAEERKSARKQREKELEKKKRQASQNRSKR